jgi:hypothetical protein
LTGQTHKRMCKTRQPNGRLLHPPMRKLTILLVLSALLGIGARAEAQFSYTVENLNQIYQPSGNDYWGGFAATLLIKNINTYDDPQIISFSRLFIAPSPRAISYCYLYFGPSEPACALNGSSILTPHGNVQTGNIPIANSVYIYSPSTDEESCVNNCFAKQYRINHVLGCQAPAPFPVDWYSGRTCDADGFTGALAMSISFRYLVPTSVPVFTFDATDLTARANGGVWPGPNVFVPVVSPEPSSWLLTATGLGFFGIAVRRRKRTTAAENVA